MALLERVVCPHCKKLTIRGKYCMNCGKDLQVEQHEVAQAQQQQQRTEQQVEQPTQQVQPQPSIEPLPEDVTEERKIVEQLSKLYSWSLRLIDLFLEGEAGVDVFNEIYQEYSSRITTLDEKRRDMVRRYEDRLKDLVKRAEELKVKHEIGEVGDRDYIRQKIEFDKEISKLRPKIGILQNPIELRLADIPTFTDSLNKKIKDLKEKGEKMGLESSMVSKIISDLNSLLEATDIMMKQHMKIKHEIQKIEIRYKIGELKQDEYLALKQRLERQLELTF